MTGAAGAEAFDRLYEEIREPMLSLCLHIMIALLLREGLYRCQRMSPS